MRRSLLLATAVVLTACSHKDQASSDTVATNETDSVSAAANATGRVVQRAAARTGVITTAPTDAPGAISIRTNDHKMTFTLAHDTVSLGLSDSVLAEVKQQMAKDTNDHGIAGAFSGFIKKTVGSALRSRVAYPVQDIQDVKYEGGRIVFTYRQPREMKFEDVSTDHNKVLAMFAPQDAQRFVAAVDSAIAATRGH